MLPPPISRPFKVMSYWAAKISPIFSFFIRLSMYSGWGAEKGLCVKVQSPAISLLSDLAVFSKNGKSMTQQKAKRFGLFLPAPSDLSRVPSREVEESFLK